MTQIHSSFYRALTPPVVSGVNLFFDRVGLVGWENIPKDKPVILVANHQNAMMDPVVCCVFISQQLHWLTRADLFKNPRVNKILRSINMLPVYRERDKVENLIDVNQAIFEEVYDRLKLNAIVCVFPEGTHRGKKQLHVLKKGVVRMAGGALTAGVKDVQILPLGLDYEDYYNYRKSLTIVIGKPIPLEQYREGFNADPGRTQNTLLQEIRHALDAVMIDIQDDHMYPALDGMRALSNKASNSNSLEKQFWFYHALCARTRHEKVFAEHVKDLGGEYVDGMKALDIKEVDYEENYSYLNLLPLIVMAPFVLAGVIAFAPMYLFTEWLQKKLVKDPLFKNSIRVVTWLFLTPVWILIMFVVSWICSGFWLWALSITASLCACGMFALWWMPLWRKWKLQVKCIGYRNSKNKRFERWTKVRRQLLDLITSK